MSVPLRQALPIYEAEYVAALAAIHLMASSGELFTLFSDNMGARYNLDKGRCPQACLPILLNICFRREYFLFDILRHPVTLLSALPRSLAVTWLGWGHGVVMIHQWATFAPKW